MEAITFSGIPIDFAPECCSVRHLFSDVMFKSMEHYLLIQIVEWIVDLLVALLITLAASIQ